MPPKPDDNGKKPTPALPQTAAESFSAWWDSTIPNSVVSQDTQTFNKAQELKRQLLAILSTVTGV